MAQCIWMHGEERSEVAGLGIYHEFVHVLVGNGLALLANLQVIRDLSNASITTYR